MKLMELFGARPNFAADGGGIRSGLSLLGGADGEPTFTEGFDPTTCPYFGRVGPEACDPLFTPLAASTRAAVRNCCCLAAPTDGGRAPTSGTAMPWTIPAPGATARRLTAAGAS